MNGTDSSQAMSQSTWAPAELEAHARVLKAMAHPVRLCILRGLTDGGERNVSGLQCSLGAPQSTVSQHLAKLRSAGLLCTRREGTEVFYRLATPVVRRVLRALTASSPLSPR